MADSKEAQFQQDIIDALAAQGWLVGTASGYDWRTRLDTDVLSHEC
jgi:type I restriction enzyme R subunit